MLAQRVASAAVGIPIIVLLIWAGGGWYAGAASLIVLIAADEFQAPHHGGRAPLALVAAGPAAALPAGAFVGLDWVVWFTVGGVLIPLAWVTLRADPATALNDWTWAVAGLLYVGLLGSHMVLLRELDNGRDWVFLAVFGTFAADTSAYFVGRAIGRRKLAPAVSPGKTVEGTAAGLAFGAGGVIFLNWVSGLRIGPDEIAGLAVLLPLLAVIGDLGESLLKRSAG